MFSHMNYFMEQKLGFPGGSDSKEFACMQETWVLPLGQENPLEKGMPTPSCIFAWKAPWTEEPDELQWMGLQSWISLSD